MSCILPQISKVLDRISTDSGTDPVFAFSPCLHQQHLSTPRVGEAHPLNSQALSPIVKPNQDALYLHHRYDYGRRRLGHYAETRGPQSECSLFGRSCLPCCGSYLVHQHRALDRQHHISEDRRVPLL